MTNAAGMTSSRSPATSPAASSTGTGPSRAALVRRIQQALKPVGMLQGVSVYLKTPQGERLAVVEDGQIVPADSAAKTDSPFDQGGTFCFALEDGDRIFVQDAHQGPATAKLVGAILQASLQGLEIEKREELLLQELGSNWESLEVLYDISTDALRSGDIKEALQRLIERLAALQEGLRAALFIKREGVFHPLVSTAGNASALTSEQLGVVERAMRDLRVVLVNQLAEVPDERASWHRASSVAAAPFSWQGCIGFVVVWSEEQNCRFDSPFSRVLEAITYQVSVMMEGDRLNRKVRENELLAQEVEIASSIQQTLLLANAPKDVPALEIASCSLPSQRIDGDFHDFFQHPDGTVDVLIGDVMGKGVAAALLGAATKSQFLRATANLALRSTTGAPRPAEIVTRAATRLSDRLISLDRFVTLCYARFDAATRSVVFVDCGHTSMIVESKAKPECDFLRGRDLPLGVLPDYRCEEHSVAFHPGETYLLYSDGVTENRSPEGEMFGAERLADCVQSWSSLGPAQLVAQIRDEAVRFRGSEKFSDDFTCIAVRIKFNPAHGEPVARRSAVFDCNAGELGRLRAWLRHNVELAGRSFSEEVVARLELSCSEVFANCVIHAGDGGETGGNPVGVESRIFPDRATIEFRHRGPQFDPLSVSTPSFDGTKDGGFGVYIVLRSADDARFAREPDGTNVTTLSFLGGAMDRKL
jgi:sigma-B regulation protein RsbU (phosphoserine phosphatase)